ncbi:MAG: flagellar hook-associated protein FlgL [Vitreoscilla sp.]|nr:flagellar hook-associated protein FlgL [Burkholderiales bacterium]MBP6336407.1 flagellar hook-associated protein FlgL [Vitreoscilla sp.]MBP6674166.1 flagellar hook-associated protein FlgL [Vitreoscilla sp.]
MFRISTSNAYAAAIDNLQRRQKEMSEAQQQLTSGKRVLQASDDPTAAARGERARALMQRQAATQRAVDASKNSMTLTESALGDAGELVQQARTLIVQAGNASYTDKERQDLANQLAQIRGQLVGVANRNDGAGGYVFSGQGVGQPPFIDRPGGVQYTGTGGQMQVASDEPLPLTLDGQKTWLSAQSGNGVFKTSNANSQTAWIDAGRVTDPSLLTDSTYEIQFSVSGGNTTYSILKDGAATAVVDAPFQSGKAIEIDGMAVSISGKPAQGDSFSTEPSQPNLSIFDALDTVITDLKKTARSNSQITQTVQTALRDMDATSNALQSARSMAGETLNRIDGVASRVADLQLFAETTRSNAEDLDMVQAISEFQNQQTGYQAAMQTYASVQKMSLFQYING